MTKNAHTAALMTPMALMTQMALVAAMGCSAKAPGAGEAPGADETPTRPVGEVTPASTPTPESLAPAATAMPVAAPLPPAPAEPPAVVAPLESSPVEPTEPVVVAETEPVLILEAEMNEPVEEKSCGGISFARESRPTEVLLVVDRSGSLTDYNYAGTNIDRWEGLKPTLTEMVSTTMNSGVWWGLKFFPEHGGHVYGQCAPETLVADIHSPLIDGGNGADVIERIEATTADGDGTPTGQAMKAALEHLLERETVSNNPKVMVLATDGEPNCKGPNSGSGDYAEEQVRAAFAAGYPTYVVGIDKGGKMLNRLALAGGVPRPNPNPPDPNVPLTEEEERNLRRGDIGYDAAYLATSPEEIRSVFQAITEQVASCVFELDEPPPVPENIAVDFNSTRTQRDPTRANGWEYVTEEHKQLEVYGEWCDRIRDEAGNTVTIKYGCPDIPIPPPQ